MAGSMGAASAAVARALPSGATQLLVEERPYHDLSRSSPRRPSIPTSVKRRASPSLTGSSPTSVSRRARTPTSSRGRTGGGSGATGHKRRSRRHSEVPQQPLLVGFGSRARRTPARAVTLGTPSSPSTFRGTGTTGRPTTSRLRPSTTTRPRRPRRRRRGRASPHSARARRSSCSGRRSRIRRRRASAAAPPFGSSRRSRRHRRHPPTTSAATGCERMCWSTSRAAPMSASPVGSAAPNAFRD